MSTVTIRPAVDATELPVVDTLEGAESDVTAAQAADVFPQSVASGGPTPTGIILWTRINPEQYDPSQSLRVEVATEELFEDLVIRSELPDPGVKPTDNYTLRVDLDGLLDPDTAYYYRFSYRGVRSQTGRCRTLPSEDASLESLQFGVLNCQNYQNGYFGAMTHLAETDVDFVLHLGDYIYEEVGDGPYKDRRIDLPDGETHPMSLDDFRHIYETYKADPDLQTLHERHTVIQTWDDHAIANDRYWDYEADAPVFPNHPCGDSPEFTRYLTRVGIQAWWEFIPARITYDPEADHIHDSFELYTATQFGDLVTLLLTDERLFRSQPLSRTEKLLPWKREDPSRTMLGTTQREWFLTKLRETETPWTVWANAVLFKPLIRGLWKDSWDGYDAERTNIVETLADVRRGGDTTVVTLTGDMHMTLATRLQKESGETTPIGVELMTPSVTSVNLSEKASRWVEERVNRVIELMTSSVAAVNTSEQVVEKNIGDVCGRLANQIACMIMRWWSNYTLTDSANWGYSVIEFSRDACIWTVYWVDKTVHSTEAECTPVYRIRLPLGDSVIQEQHEEIREPIGVRSKSD